MCGIFFTCSRNEHVEPDDATRDALVARGPDSLKLHHVQVNTSSLEVETTSTKADQKLFLTFAASVLSLRGDGVCVQPLIDSQSGSVLCWNGEAWKIDETPVQGNDTEQVFRLLLDSLKSVISSGEEEIGLGKYSNVVAKVLTRVAGPYAFVFYDATQSTVYYGRDRLGRRSLVSNSSESPTIEISLSSLSFEKLPATEVATDGIQYLDLKIFPLRSQTVPWPTLSPLINRTIPENDAIQPIPSSDAVAYLKQHLTESIRLRVLDVPTYTVHAEQSSDNPSRIAILFSGGLDCTLLARLVHNNLPPEQPIDLLNVAFENPRTIRAAAQSKQKSTNSNTSMSPYETCPDRITARSSFAELTATCPTRTWRLVAIDVPYSETLAHRSTVIRLMSPHNTEMDLSITLALYFASRGQGQATTFSSSLPQSSPTPYTTTSRVLLSGLGADELFGGYARHGAAFNRGSFAALNSELDLDFTRIGTRNLGRDDRVMAHWGREIRYPYLDEDFVRAALGLPVWEKVGFRNGKDVPRHFEGRPSDGGNSAEGISGPVGRKEDLDPAKMVLRLMAWEFGLTGVAAEKKRAIQFGARTAKMEGGRTKGTDVLGI